MANGIPPLIESISELEELVTLMKEEILERLQKFDNIKESFGVNIEEIAEHHGHITWPEIVPLFNKYGAKFESTVTEEIDELLRNVTRNTNNTGGVQ